MKYVDFVEGDCPAKMSISDCEMPTLGEGQVLVKVKAFGVNRADTLQRQGKYPAPNGESPILGLEMSGEICEVGNKVTAWNLGDRVFGLVAGGGYAEYVAVNSEHLLPVLARVDILEAAGIAEVFLTAYQSLVLIGDLQPNSHVLIHAGASGVGLAAIQLAKSMNCAVAVTSSSVEKLDACRKSGADFLINYHQHDFCEEIKNRFDKIDLIVDFVGADYLNRNLKVLNIDGCIVYLAMLGGRYADKLDMALLLAKRARIMGSTLRNRSDAYKADLISRFTQQCLSLFDSSELKANIDTLYPVQEIAIAHERIEANDTQGKLIGYW